MARIRSSAVGSVRNWPILVRTVMAFTLLFSFIFVGFCLCPTPTIIHNTYVLSIGTAALIT